MSDLSNQIHFSSAYLPLEDFDPDFDISIETILEQHFADMPAEDSDEYMHWLHVHVFQDAIKVVTRLTGDFDERKDALAWLLDLKSNAPFSMNSFAAYVGCRASDLQEQVFEMEDMQKAIEQMRKKQKKADKKAARI